MAATVDAKKEAEFSRVLNEIAVSIVSKRDVLR
jgi:hypothetical protein